LILSVLPAHASPTYTAGVKVGDWASYAPLNVTYRSNSTFFPEPQYLKDLNKTAIATETVTHVSASLTNVTIQSATLYRNGTTRTEVSNGDLVTGAGNLTYALIAGGLSSGDHIWMTTTAPTINETVVMTYLGVSRSVNIYNTTSSDTTYGSLKISAEFIWDQQSGIVLEAKAFTVFKSMTLGYFVEYLDIRATGTNIFGSTSPDFQISVNPSSLSVQPGNSGTTTVTLTSVNGFTGLVSLTTDSSLASLSTASLTLTSGGTQTSVLTFSTTATTSTGSYVVTITGTSPLTHHDTTLSVTVGTATSAPYFTVVASHPTSVTSGSSATSTITVAAVNGFTGTVTLTDTVPTGLTCTAIAPTTITNSGTASLSCSSTTPGTYTVTITAASGTTSHTTATTITIAAAPSQAPSSPATILGLDPTLFYGLIAIVVVGAIATVGYLAMKARSKEVELPSQPSATVQ